MLCLKFYVFLFRSGCYPHVLPFHRKKFIFYNTHTLQYYSGTGVRKQNPFENSLQYLLKQTKAFKSLERVRLVEGENEWEMQIKTNEKMKKYNSNVISLFFVRKMQLQSNKANKKNDQ